MRFSLPLFLTALSLCLLLFVGSLQAEDETVDESALEATPAAASEPLFPAELGPLPIESVPGFLATLSAQSCNTCHTEIHDQWAASGHATASTNASYLAASRSLGDPALCDECHKPLLQQRAVVRRGPGGGAGSRVDNPAWDPILSIEGVTCVACHLRGDAIVGPRDLPSGQSPHPVQRDDRLSSPEACAFCHQLALPGAEDHPFLDTVGEWSRSPHGQAGITCQQCHMPRVSGVIAGSRYAAFSSHAMTEGRSPSAMARALLLDLDIKSASVQRGETFRATAALSNIGAGHAVPTGDPSHRLQLSFDVEDAQGKRPRGVKTGSLWFGRKVQDEHPFEEISDSRLLPGESRTLDYSFIAHNKASPGAHSLVIAVDWWSIDPERAADIGLAEKDARIRILERRIPIDIN